MHAHAEGEADAVRRILPPYESGERERGSAAAHAARFRRWPGAAPVAALYALFQKARGTAEAAVVTSRPRVSFACLPAPARRRSSREIEAVKTIPSRPAVCTPRVYGSAARKPAREAGVLREGESGAIVRSVCQRRRFLLRAAPLSDG